MPIPVPIRMKACATTDRLHTGIAVSNPLYAGLCVPLCWTDLALSLIACQTDCHSLCRYWVV